MLDDLIGLVVWGLVVAGLYTVITLGAPLIEKASQCL